jgi:hypothetical protein
VKGTDVTEAPEIDRLAAVMHDAYERAAMAIGWETQERSRVPWPEVPEANRIATRAGVLALLDELQATAEDRMTNAEATSMLMTVLVASGATEVFIPARLRAGDDMAGRRLETHVDVEGNMRLRLLPPDDGEHHDLGDGRELAIYPPTPAEPAEPATA